MLSLAESLFARTPVGSVAELPAAGSALENPYVYDASAREVLQWASRGQVQILEQRHAHAGEETLVVHLRFRRLS